jgi:hypothetical protein
MDASSLNIVLNMLTVTSSIIFSIIDPIVFSASRSIGFGGRGWFGGWG